MPESPVLSSTPFLIEASTTSVERRLWQNTMVATFCLRKRVASLDASPEIGRADAELRIHHRRVVDHEGLLAGGRAALVQLDHRLPGEPLRQVARIGDGGGGHDELRRGPVVPADALEPAQHVGEMAAEDAAIGVQLVDHDVLEVLEEVHPLGVMRQDPRVQHVGIGQHQVRPRAHRAARVLRRVAVVGEHPHVGQRPRQLHQLGELILRERLGGEEVEHPRLRLLHQRLEHGQVVAEGLAGGGRRDHHEVLALGHRVEGLGLVRVELLDAARLERFHDAGVERGRKRREDGGFGVEVPNGGDERAGLERRQELIEELPDLHGSSYV